MKREEVSRAYRVTSPEDSYSGLVIEAIGVEGSGVSLAGRLEATLAPPER